MIFSIELTCKSRISHTPADSSIKHLHWPKVSVRWWEIIVSILPSSQPGQSPQSVSLRQASHLLPLNTSPWLNTSFSHFKSHLGSPLLDEEALSDRRQNMMEKNTSRLLLLPCIIKKNDSSHQSTERVYRLQERLDKKRELYCMSPLTFRVVLLVKWSELEGFLL